MKLTLLRDESPMLEVSFNDYNDPVSIEEVSPQFEDFYDTWIQETDYIVSHDDQDGGYEGRTNGLDDIRAFEQRVLLLVHRFGEGWRYDVSEVGIAKHLQGQHDQLIHAGIRVAQGEAEVSRIAESKKLTAAIAERVIKDAGAQYEKDVLKYREQVKNGQQSKATHQKDGKYTEERQKLHAEIVGRIAGATPTSKDPTFILMGGLPGSGKSTIVEQKELPDYVRIDSDAIKQMLPEYAGWNAGLLQSEADDIIGKILVQATQERKNVLLDGTLKTYNKADKIVNVISGLGYKVGLVYSDVSPEESMTRAVERYHRSGRLVDPMYIASHDHQNRATYEKLKAEVDFYELYDNNERGKPPQLKESGHAKAR